ncbi:MAG: transposase [Candidatus Krumholzibacteriia bacterium]
MELILSRPHSGFNVHVGEAVAPDDKISLTRVARYMLRASVVMSRISYDGDHATVRIDPHDPHSEGPIDLDVLDFIARLTIHIPESHERLVHYYGLYSNASNQRRVSGGRDKTSASPADHFDGDESEWLKMRRTRWAQLIRKVRQEDPLLCPRCGGTAAAGQCASSLLSPIRRLSTRYFGTSLSCTPTRRLRAIILRPGSAGHLSGEPGTPRK